MNLETFPEQAATFLSTLEWIGYVAAGVIYLFYYLPAWKRFRTPALMLLVASCALGMFVVLFDQTLGTTSSLPPNDWWKYFLVRQIAMIASYAAGTTGSLLFLRDYVRLKAASPSSPD